MITGKTDTCRCRPYMRRTSHCGLNITIARLNYSMMVLDVSRNPARVGAPSGHWVPRYLVQLQNQEEFGLLPVQQGWCRLDWNPLNSSPRVTHSGPADSDIVGELGPERFFAEGLGLHSAIFQGPLLRILRMLKSLCRVPGCASRCPVTDNGTRLSQCVWVTLATYADLLSPCQE